MKVNKQFNSVWYLIFVAMKYFSVIINAGIGRWFIFRDVPDKVVVFFHKISWDSERKNGCDDDEAIQLNRVICSMAEQEWGLRRRKRNASRKLSNETWRAEQS